MRAALTVLAMLIAAPAAAQDRPAAYTNAETCVRENVTLAIAASSGATDAAEFLLEYLCAAPVGAASAYERNMAGLAAFQQMTAVMGSMGEAATEISEATDDAELNVSDDPLFNLDDMMDGISVDPVTGDYVVQAGTDSSIVGVLRGQAAQMGQFGSRPPQFLRELTGQLVAAHRR